MNHEHATGARIHTPYRQVFANDAARLGDTTLYNAGDLYKKAFQVDTQAEYVLTVIAPTTWTAVSGGGGGGGNPLYDPADTANVQAIYMLDGGGTDDSVNALDLSVGAGSPVFDAVALSQDGALSCLNTIDGATRYDGDATATYDPLRILGALSIEYWIYPTVLGGIDYHIAQGGDGATADKNFNYNLASNGTTLRYAHMFGVATQLTLSTPSVLQTYVWQHLACVRQANGVDVGLYYNGQLVASGTLGNAPTDGSTGIFFIGNNAAASVPFVGRMFGMRIRNAILTPAQVAASYYRGVRGL